MKMGRKIGREVYSKRRAGACTLVPSRRQLVALLQSVGSGFAKPVSGLVMALTQGCSRLFCRKEFACRASGCRPRPFSISGHFVRYPER